MPPAQQQQEGEKINLQSHKWSKWCQWNGRGAMVQMVIVLLALQILKKSPLSVVLAGLAMCQFIENWSRTSAANLTFYEFNLDGTIKAMQMKNPPSF